MGDSVPTRPGQLFDGGRVLTGDVSVSLCLRLAILNDESAFLRLNRLATNCADNGSWFALGVEFRIVIPAA
jgi:hypothetical protein